MSNPLIQRLESQVRSYCRSFPATFATAEGARLTDRDGHTWLDFFAGAGALNYGHNEPRLREALVEYISAGGITHSLDLATTAKTDFLRSFERRVLAPRKLDYRVMFPGPTGTNAVEAALKLARKVTGRTRVIAFTRGFHGMTLGSLATTGNAAKRAGAGLPLGGVDRMPFCGYIGPDADTLGYLETFLADPSSGVDAPAAFIVETVQGEGGVNVATTRWLKRLARIARDCGALLVIDDIQVGCGRTGPFFSFEAAGIRPDIVCLSKAVSGYGLPLALTLIAPEHDVWAPGEHNGTFRGHDLAFVTAHAALEAYWQDDALERAVAVKAGRVAAALDGLADRTGASRRGRGLIQGLAFDDPTVAPAVSRDAFERGLIIETAGPRGEVLKLLPPLNIDDADLEHGLELLADSVRRVTDAPDRRATGRLGASHVAHAPVTTEVAP